MDEDPNMLKRLTSILNAGKKKLYVLQKRIVLKNDMRIQCMRSVMLNAAQNVCPFDLNGGCINPPDDLEKDNDDASSSGEDKVSDASERVDWMVKPVLTFFCPRYLAVTTTPSLHCCHLNLKSCVIC